MELTSPRFGHETFEIDLVVIGFFVAALFLVRLGRPQSQLRRARPGGRHCESANPINIYLYFPCPGRTIRADNKDMHTHFRQSTNAQGNARNRADQRLHHPRHSRGIRHLRLRLLSAHLSRDRQTSMGDVSNRSYKKREAQIFKKNLKYSACHTAAASRSARRCSL